MDADYKGLNYYRLGTAEVLDELQTTDKGLAAHEAAERLERLGPNSLHRTKHVPAIVIFLRQFKSIFIIMLLLSAALAIYLHDGRTAAILILISLTNAGIGYFQEHKAETLMNSLERLLVPKAKVMRGAKVIEADSTELVLGDIVYVEAGDSVPADLRVLEEQELATNDFALTGESNPSRKFIHAISGDVPLGSRHNLLFMGTTVALGSGYGVVIGTGMHSELGRIASLSQSTHAESSPLQKEMNNLATRIAQGTVVLAVVLVLLGLKQNFTLHDAVLFGIGIAAAMIPNGLVAEVSITLAQSAGRLAKARALVKKLSAVETLGATNYILTDKTGTLTKNEMTVQELLIGRTKYNVTGTGYEASGEITSDKDKPLTKKALKEIELFFATGALASNAKVNPPDDDHPNWYVVGDPTEGALITLARKAGVDIDSWEKAQPEIKEFQFDSARKLLSSIRTRGKEQIVFVKGAPENLLEKSNEIWDHGHIRKLTQADRKFLLDYNEQQAKAALRNLAFGFRVLPAKTKQPFAMDKVEENFTFLGMVSMLDPLRDTVPAAMKAANRAHIKVSIITGDYPTTAKAIARKAELGKDITIVMGEDLDKLADSQILQLVEHGGTVFSRVSPEDKLRIVEIVKQSGHVVAVTGDGINDAPALKRADIGVAMGRTGTDVAKDAAEIVLLDDSFDTLVGAVEQGRLTFRNIRKAARCAMTDNAGELFVILISLFAQIEFHIPAAITAIQILAIDIIAQMLPITSLGWDTAQRSLMHDKPRRPEDHILNSQSLMEFISFGALTAALGYGNFLFFFIRQHLSPAYLDHTSLLYAQATMLTYLTVVLCQFVNIMFVRADEHEKFFTNYLWGNKKLLGAFAISFFLIANLMYNPWVRPYFGGGALSALDWITAIVCAGFYFATRLSQRFTRKHSRRAVVQLHREVYGS